MNQLSEERFEQILGERLTGLATKKDLTQSEARVIKRIDQAQEELARMVKHGFDDVLERLDVRERVTIVEQKLHRIGEALHLEL